MVKYRESEYKEMGLESKELIKTMFPENTFSISNYIFLK